MFLTCSSFYYLQTVDEHYYFYYPFLNCQRKDMKLTTTEHWVFQWGSCSKPGQEQLCTWHVSGWPEMWNEAQSLLSVRELVQHAPVGLRGVENTPLSQLDAPSLRWVRCLVLLQDETGWDSHPFHAWKCWNVSEYTGKKKKIGCCSLNTLFMKLSHLQGELVRVTCCHGAWSKMGWCVSWSALPAGRQHLMMGKGISVLPCRELSCNEACWRSEGCQHSVKQVVDSLWPSRPALLATASAAVA